ncbi:hypothetical protein CNMCM5793_008192 [Aspergillus hiratsukae]|uniref:F-box domain-containing protein n=1 Tax=Aspergillus hiratsukae TaxID=1194566 RepID=A0A8H6UTJ0_9EURO|nr:hypothetical protein CNMCM5793_008192 [Aspergillus hiratsukae]KAF7163709.1 hypothetical protein CNMCM6106_000525 [Aspergillus hiratsukae]
MDSLPTELLTIILHHLYYETRALRWQDASLARHTVVSRRWQAILEPMIWKYISVLRPYALIWLEAYTSGKQHRIARIKWVRRILWAPYVNFALAERLSEAMEDYPMALACVLLYLYHRLYRQAFADMFHILSRWESTCDNLMIELDLFGEHLESPRLPVPVWSWDASEGAVALLWRAQVITHLAHLTKQDASAYPILHSVRSPSLEDSVSPKSFKIPMRPSAFFQLLSRLPNVRRVSAGESASIPPFALVALREERHQLAHCLSLVPPAVEEFEYEIAPQREMSWTPVEDAASYLSFRGLDEVSIALRTLSMRLKVLHLSNVRINSELFWPSAEEDNVIGDALHWPMLEDLEITDMPPYTADGKWILDNDPDIETFVEMEDFDDQWDYDEMGFDRRGLIRSDEVDKLYSAMGKAAQRMPRLRFLVFKFRDETPGDGVWECLTFYRVQKTGKVELSIGTVWEYNLGEEVITSWGLEGEKAEEFRTHRMIEFDDWPPRGTARPA